MLWGLASTLLLTSLALLTLSLRARRIGSSPHCRKCRFDLSGLDPTCCPECGRDLLHAGAVIYGRRARRPLFLAIGAASLLLGLATAGLAISATSGDLNPYKPAWLLEIEAACLKDDARDAAATELLARHKKAALSPDRLAALVNASLDAQQSPATWASSPWWELLDASFAAGAVSDKQRQRYAKQALAALDLDLPEFMLASEPWPARVTRFQPEPNDPMALAPAQPVAWLITLDQVSCDGQPLTLTKSGHERPNGWQFTAVAQARSVTPMGFGFSGYTHVSSMAIPFPHHQLALSPLQPGRHTLSLEYTVRAYAGANFSGRSGGPLQLDLASPTATWPLRIDHAFAAKADVGEIARLATSKDAPDFDPSMQVPANNTLDAIEIVPSDPPRTRFMYSVTRNDIREGVPWIVGRVELRSGERVWPAVSVWPLDGPADPIIVTLAPRPHAPQGQGLDLSVPDFPRLDKADVVIVPDLHAAAMAGINAPVWGEEIVIADVPINWSRLMPEDQADPDDTGDE